MKIVTQFRVLLGRAQLMGTDSFGNTYYQHKKRRWVLYQGLEEGSKVPPLWHGWLHKTTNAVPREAAAYPWQKPHQPNLTGTPHAYVPWWPLAKKLYEPWRPDC